VIRHIDLSSVLRRSVCDLYSNLVTRPTGAAVRTEIEQLVAETPSPSLTVIDFSNVGLLDYSCADEVVAKLLLRFAPGTAPCEAYFVFRGLEEWHLHAIEGALSRYGLALVLETQEGNPALIGAIADDEQRVWQAVHQFGAADAATVAAFVGSDGPATERVLETLSARRLLMRLDQQYLALVARPAPTGVQSEHGEWHG
jgi:hypothetical protein